MAPTRTSNLERGRWRNKCREQLSKHIQSKTGIVIEPSQVRLITGADDPYTWKVLPEKKHLFTKNLSDHSIGSYRELCEGIGVTFEAVLVTATITTTGSTNYEQQVVVAEPSQVSFSARIDELQKQNLRLERELRQWKGQATAESERRWLADQELDQLRKANQTLHEEVQRYTLTVGYFRKTISKYGQVRNAILHLMEELKTGPSCNEEIFGELGPLFHDDAASSL